LRAADAIGATLPGLPLIVAGRNQRIAWGLTSAYVDDQDVYYSEVDPTAPALYRAPDGLASMTQREERIHVRGSELPHLEIVRETRHGPVLPAGLYRIFPAIPPNAVASLRWTALDDVDRSFAAGLRLMQSGNVAEALASLDDFAAPAQNVAVADRESIALAVVGKAPLRHPDHDSGGRLPTAGWRAQNLWQGYLPTGDLPRAVNPPEGAVANANNRTTNAGFPRHLSRRWDAPYRIRRLSDLLDSRDFHTPDSFARIQNDEFSPFALAVLAPLLSLVRESDVPGPDTHPLQHRGLERLLRWNGEMDADRGEPLIFAAWMQHLHRRLLANRLGGGAEAGLPLQPLFLERVFASDGADSPWCDNIASSVTETCRATALRALADALDELERDWGGDAEGWRWGDAHAALHRHPPLGRAAVLHRWFNLRHETGGGRFTLAMADYAGDGDDPYAAISGAGYRAVYDLGDPERSRFVAATGQSGHFLSPHYDDLTDIWGAGGYLPMQLLLPKDIKRSVGTLHLTPADR